MTGTALTEEKEFRDIYGMDVVEIPPIARLSEEDLHDAVYKTKREKLNAIVEAVKEAHAKRPAGPGRYDYDRSIRTAFRHVMRREAYSIRY